VATDHRLGRAAHLGVGLPDVEGCAGGLARRGGLPGQRASLSFALLCSPLRCSIPPLIGVAVLHGAAALLAAVENKREDDVTAPRVIYY
jgi:hypothetical protein